MSSKKISQFCRMITAEKKKNPHKTFAPKESSQLIM